MARVVDEPRKLRPDRVPPNNLEAEESVLGSMLLAVDAIAEVIEVVQAEDFYRGSHRKLFGAVLDMYGRGEPVDAVTVVAELTRKRSEEHTSELQSLRHLVCRL